MSGAETVRPETETGVSTKRVFDSTNWQPKTELGRLIKEGKIKTIDEVYKIGKRIMESEIIDFLLSNLTSEFLEIGQSKGKFGGGKASVWKQTQKKTAEGNKPKFQTAIVVGNRGGFVGVGVGKAKETVPAREKAIRNAKLNLIRVKMGCGSWACHCGTSHSIPFAVSGKCGSIRLTLMPAPKGSGLVVEDNCQKILKQSGIKDIYSKVEGTTASKLNVVFACFDALNNLSKIKIDVKSEKVLGVSHGS
jgi:small subunit ribosomal protein S5